MSDSPENKSTGGELTCAFCGKPESQAKKMIVVGAKQQPICDECIHICTQILSDAGVKDR
ncbi:MAG: ClpX C4-type zinc finger protein [Ketobacteraceae bacterium]|nr:ClpX C4-type zinc finger protein [Ketobacteraceae bacterium]